MNRIKRGSYLILLLLLLGIGNALQAYVRRLINRTPYVLNYKFEYVSALLCHSDTGRIFPGKVKDIPLRGCLLKKLEVHLAARVNYNIASRDYVPSLGRRGNATFEIWDRSPSAEKIKLVISRKK